MNSVQAGNTTVCDTDYYIEYGSEYVISQFKYTHINNTDNILITWEGRSTLASTVSPILLQIYNNNSSTWETLVNETRMAADTDFRMQASQSINLSNYYDSNNVVSGRVYQLVI